MACIDYTLFGKSDEREKLLVSWYPEENPVTIAIDLELWREYYHKSVDDFPTTKSSFSYFRNHKIDNPLKTVRSKYDVTPSQYKAWSKVVYDLWPTEVRRSRMSMLAEMFSEKIDEYQNQKEHKGWSRAKCLDKMGGTKTVLKEIVDGLVARTDDDILSSAPMLFRGKSYDELNKTEKEHLEYIHKQYQLLQEYFDGIDILARPYINNYETAIDVKTFAEEYDDYREDEKESLTETKGKRYADHREADIETSLTEKAKRILGQLMETNSKGGMRIDDIGYPLRVDPRAAFRIIVSSCWTSTPSTFISDIRDRASTYRWMNDLADILENDYSAACAMWASAKKAKNTYIYLNLKNGKYYRRIINTRATDNTLLKEMNTNFGHNVLDPEYSVYNEDGEIINTPKKAEAIKKKLLGFVDEATMARNIDPGLNDPYFEPEIDEAAPGEYMAPRNKKITVDGKTFWAKPGRNAMQWYLNTYPEEAETLARMARGMGIDITAEDIRRAAMIPFKESDKKYFHRKVKNNVYKNRYSFISTKIINLYEGFVRGINYEKHMLGIANSIDDLFRALNLAVYDQVADKGMDEDVIRQTYTTPNLLSEVMLTLRNERKVDDATYTKMIEDNWLKYEGHTLNGKPTGFLDFILNNPEGIIYSDIVGRAQMFSIMDLSSFNHVLYEDMKKQQVATAQFALYRGNNGYEKPAFIMPVTSDYTICYVYQVPEYALPTYSDKKPLLADPTAVNKYGEQGIYNTDASIVKILADEVLIEYYRMLAIEDRQKNAPDRVVLSSYEKNGKKFQIFPEMNDMQFREIFESYLRRSESDGMEYLRYTVAKLLKENRDKDWDKFVEQGAFYAPEFKKDIRIDKNGKITVLNPSFLQEFEAFSVNNFYVRQQFTKLFLNDTAQFDNMLEFEKRAMMIHAPGIPVYHTSDNDIQTVLYIPDIEEASVYKKDFDEFFDALVAEKLMSREQADINKTAYDSIKLTDGQGFRTLPSWRRIKRGLGEWTDAQEEAYRLVMSGTFSQEILETLNPGPTKLRYCGYQEIEAAETNTGVEQKPVKLNVLHKYSEQILLPFHLLNKGTLITEMSNSPMIALSKAIYEMIDDENLNDDYCNKTTGERSRLVPELILFKSGCKVGYHNPVKDLWETTDGQPLGIDEISKRIKSAIAFDPNSVQSLSMTGLGKAATIDAVTEDTLIHIASQAEKMILGNMQNSDTITVAGAGKMKAVDGRKLYDEISTAITISLWKKLCDDLGARDLARRVLLEEMEKMPFVSEETKMALTRVDVFQNRNRLALYAPQIQKDAQSILLSIVRKRMTKHKAPGARFAQRTSLGWDVGEIKYQSVKQFDGKEKLEIVFEGKGKNKRVKYIEAYVPLTNSALSIFADDKGEISPKRLRELVADGTIPEEMLYAVVYRTPSDAEHSALPIKIKGFLSPLSGRGIILPREAMVMTGHDYDGDEMPSHFKTFNVEIDEERVRKYFKDILADPERMKLEFSPRILRMLSEGREEEVFERFLGAVSRSDKHKAWWAYKVTVPKYDYSKRPYYKDENGATVMQDMAALDNARLELLFSVITSPAGSRKMIIPGGFEETKRIIKTIELLRVAKDNESLRSVICKHYNIPLTDDTAKMFIRLRGIHPNPSDPKQNWKAVSSRTLDSWLEDYKPKESPFSAHHEIDSFGYMIETAELIGMFAMNLSSFQMLQKSKASYVPFVRMKADGSAESIPTELFGINFDNKRLFDLHDVSGDNMLSRVLSRLINAAVDNGKDPILGFTNINKATVPIIALMCSLGMTEDQINLVINQPSVKSALNKMTISRSSFNSAINATIAELKGLDESSTYEAEDGALVTSSGNNPNAKLGYAKSNQLIKDKTESDFAVELVKSMEEIKSDLDDSAFQLSVLYTIKQMLGAAEDLNSFITSTVRADSSSGSVANTIGNTQNKIINYEDCKSRIQNGDFRIGGLENMVQEIEIDESMDEIDLLDILMQSPVPQYTALNYLEIQTSMDIMSRFMPQARNSWRKTATDIAKMYGYKRTPKKLIDRIVRDMMAWKLLQDPAFCSAEGVNSNAEGFAKLQDYMLSEVPANLKRLKRLISQNSKNRRIKEEAKANILRAEKYTKETGRSADPNWLEQQKHNMNLEIDADLTSLENNSFLKMLKVYHEPGSRMKPRLQFHSGGIDISKMADTIRSDWYALFRKRYGPEVNQLAADLTEYSLFTNGFGFGKYEFGHFASQRVLEQSNQKRLLRALNDVALSDFDEGTETDNFIAQYTMNHWREKNLVKPVYAGFLTQELASLFGVESRIRSNKDKRLVTLVRGRFYLIQTAPEKEPLLLRYNGMDSKEVFTEFSKLGTSNKYGQVTVEYNPYCDAESMTAYQLGERSFWGNFMNPEQVAYAESNYDTNNENFDPEAIDSFSANDDLRPAKPLPFADSKSARKGAAQSAMDELRLQIEQRNKAKENADANSQLISDDINGGYSQAELALEPIDIGEKGSDYSDLNNSAIRPFVHTWENGNQMQMQSVEQAFQIAKAALFKDVESIRLMQKNTDVATLRRQGNWVKGYNEEEWSRVKYEVMGTFIRESFEQNPDARERLLSTGNRPIILTGEKSEWATRFPMILMSVRSLFQDEAASAQSGSPIKPADTVIAKTKEEDETTVQAGDLEKYKLMIKAMQGDQNAIALAKSKGYLSITRLDRENGTVTTDKLPVTPGNIALARKQKAYVELSNKLVSILERVGVGVGTLTAEEIVAYAEAGMAINGIADFDTANVFANGLRQLIRIAEGYNGITALPEEFAHVAIEMLGDNHPLVQRLLSALRNDEAALREAFGDEYDAYRDIYEKEGGDWETKLVKEAAGKLVAKSLIRNQEIKSGGVKGLIRRIVDAIKNLFRKITSKSIEDAIFESENISSQLARNLLSGRLLDAMSFDNIGKGERFLAAKKDISNTKNVVEKLISIEIKRENILDRRLGHNPEARGKSKSYKDVVGNINQLRVNLRKDKTELAVVTYMENMLDFLRNTELNLDKQISAGSSANVICGLITTLRDTLVSNVQALDIIKEAIDDKEIEDSGNLVSTYNSVSGVVFDFHRKYTMLSRTYFEGMLSGVFGEDGVTVTVGKDKGKQLSIHEIATVGKDKTMVGGLMTRLFDSMADQDDLVLQAFDSVARSAMTTARSIQQQYATRIVSAFSKLEKETGSKDQSFAYELDEKGKMTGKYIIKEEDLQKLSSAQREFLEEMLAIKAEADKLIPPSRVKKNGIIMIPKSRLEKISEASGISGKLAAINDSRKEYIDRYLVEEEENAKNTYVDFEGNKVDMLPIKYTSKGSREYDAMTKDLASSMMAYVGMATEYSEMHKVVNILENAKYASMERDMIQERGGQKLEEHVEFSGLEYTKPFTVKQARTYAQKCLEDFMSMRVYQHTRAAEGTTPIFHLPKALLADILSTTTSYTQMAFNLQQRISNMTTGQAQIFINAAGKDVYSVKDVAWASGIWMKETADRFMDFGKDESDNYLSLFMERFDIGQKLNDESKKKQYGKSRAVKIFNTRLLFAGLEIGEDYLSATTGLAVARNVKLMLNGKEIHLYEAYEKAYRDEKNKTGAYLKLKDGVTKLDGTAFSSADELAFAKKVAGINFRLQGIYNKDDKSAIQQYSLGALIIMYRKWIAPSLKRRYGKARYSELTGTEEEGFYVTSLSYVGNVIKTMIREGESLKAAIQINWNNLTDYEKANCKKAITELGIIVGIIGGLAAIDTLPPEGDDDEKTLTWRDNVTVYQLLRLKNELGALAPTPMLVQEATKILSSPMASIRVLDNALKGLNLLNPMNYEFVAGEDAIVKSGRFKGKSKAYKYFWGLPILSIRKSIENAVDPEPLIQYYR